MSEISEQFVMRTGDVFVADQCGCKVTVQSGPGDESMAKQAPVCCCGHTMHKTGAATADDGGPAGDREQSANGAPTSMAD